MNHKKYPLTMQVNNSTQPHITFISQSTTSSTFISQSTTSSTFFPSLLPLYGYYDKFKITMPSWPLPAFATLDQFPAELINKIQALCSDKDLLALTSVNQAALAARFCNPRLQKLFFKTVEDTKQFLAYCQALQEKEAQALMLEEGQESRKRLKPALSPDTITRFTSFTREHLQEVKALTLTLYEQFTAEQYELLFTYLPGIQHLTLYLGGENACALGVLLKAAQRFALLHLAVINLNRHRSPAHLPDELWQLTTLKTLTIRGFSKVVSISEDIGRLNALKSLTLDNMQFLNAFPASLWQLNTLEVLTLRGLTITALPKDIGQLKALKALTLDSTTNLNALTKQLFFCKFWFIRSHG
jgi:hypothetical protein